jgi:truncated hemoglobin YjbI
VSEPGGPRKTPFELLGGADKIKTLVETFYDVMSEREPELARACIPANPTVAWRERRVIDSHCS